MFSFWNWLLDSGYYCSQSRNSVQPDELTHYLQQTET